MVNELQVARVVELMDTGEESDVVAYVFNAVVTDSMNRDTFAAVIDTMLSRVEQVSIEEVASVDPFGFNEMS